MLTDTDLYIIASALQQSCIDEYDEEMIDNIFVELQGRNKVEIKRFRAAYARVGLISIVMSKCSICEQEKTVISIDSSEGEYGAGCICKNCALIAFEEFEKSKG